MQTIEYWLSLTSPYSYLATMRMFDQAWNAGLDVTWRPIFMPRLLKVLGRTTNPFLEHPNKLEYLFQDVAREAHEFGIEFHRPSVFPQNAQTVAKVAVVACKEGFGPQFCHAAMIANFRDQRDIAGEDIVQSVLETFCSPSEAGKLIKLSQSAELEATLQSDCEQAIERGVFGVPTFIVSDQLFWGNDRLDRALAYAGSTSSAAALASSFA